MDAARMRRGTSPLHVPHKRNTIQSQPRGGVPYPVVQRIPERSGDANAAGHLKQREEASAQEGQRMRRSCTRKRYEDLQSVSMGVVGFPTVSCSVMLSGVVNGADPGSAAPPPARLPPRPPSKDVWPQGAEASGERPQGRSPTSRVRRPVSWGPGQGPSGQDQVRAQGGDQAPTGTNWASVAAQGSGREAVWDQVPDEGWNADRDPGRGGGSPDSEQTWGPVQGLELDQSNSSGDRGNVWRPDRNMTKVPRAEVEQRLPGHFPPACRRSGSEAGGDPKPVEDQKPVVVPTKKEAPTYPPGSQEERWQVQIVSKGRVPCPKCKSVSRKTVEGLKKHMENCRLQLFTCPHCGKQLKSSTGMKYHVMADHSYLPSVEDAKDLDNRVIKDKLRKALKRLGKLKCSKEGCTSAFTSIMGYFYHMRKCGKEESELEKMMLSCFHCGKTYRSKAGLEYHLKSEHPPTTQKSEDDEALQTHAEDNTERTASGRVQRASAQLANFHMAEIANNDLPKDWPKRKFQYDLVPDDKKLKYARPGLPAFSQEVLRKWKNEVKLQRKVQCPNQGCGCTYTSVSGLKAHLGLCTLGDFEAGKYRCLICNKEFNSESGVKYHINSIHSQEWFVTNKKASKKFEKFLKNKSKEFVQNVDKQILEQYHHHHLHHHHHHHLQHYEQHQHHPLQPLHHLPQQMQPLYPDHQDLSPPQANAQQLHYTPLEPPPGPLWLDVDPGGATPDAEQAPIEMDLPDRAEEESVEVAVVGVKCREREERGKSNGKRKDCFEHGGNFSGDSEAERRQMDQWNLKRPGVMEEKQPRKTKNL